MLYWYALKEYLIKLSLKSLLCSRERGSREDEASEGIGSLKERWEVLQAKSKKLEKF